MLLELAHIFAPNFPGRSHAGYLAHRFETDAAINRVLECGTYILGREIENFESAFGYFVEAG